MTEEEPIGPVDRSSEEELAEQILVAGRNPVVDGLLHTVSGLLAVLNENLQIIALNDTFMQHLGIDDPVQAFGMRQGEILGCIHARKEPAGCGTTSYCSTCGAAIAMVASMREQGPVERVCALTARREGRVVHMALLVRSQPLVIEERQFLLIFIRDITRQQQQAALERAFYHDVNNMLGALVGASELLAKGVTRPELIRAIHQTALRLQREVAIQSCLARDEAGTYTPTMEETRVGTILEELRTFFAGHPAAAGRRLEVATTGEDLPLRTDSSLLQRILSNMVVNALEASCGTDPVRVHVDRSGGPGLSFHVWNRQAIPPDVARRVFERNFSTKEGGGRGVGTFSMKLFGERVLGGKVSFTSSEGEGTRFTFTLPG